MAIIQNKEADGLRFGKVENLYQESIIHENYVADMINSYGLDIRYYKLKTFYPEIFKPILDANHLSIHAYGEEFAQEWEDPVNMIAYIKWDNDSVILNSYGIQPDSTMTMWVTQTNFAIAMAKKLSKWREYKTVAKNEFILDFDNWEDLVKNKNKIEMEFQTDLFNGSLHAIMTDNILAEILNHDSCSTHSEEYRKLEKPIIIPCDILEHGRLKIDTGRINPLLYTGNHYDPMIDEGYDWMFDCHLHLEVTTILKDKHGHIRVMGRIAGGVIYHDTEVIGKYIDKICPEVGDLIDVPVPSENGNMVYKQKYEIVHIEQSKTNENYMNPFLRNYMYEINLRAYVASGQEEPNGPSDAAIELKDKLELINDASENAAKKIGLYEDFEDDVYGGYDKIITCGKPSVQRDASKSTINNFDPPKKTKGLKKSAHTLFIFKDMKMALQLIDDPKNNNSYLRLIPAKKNVSVEEGMNYLNHLRADDDTLVLVNDIQTYLLAHKYKMNKMLQDLDEESYCIKPIRLKHEVYAQHNGWADQPFHLVDNDESIELNMDLQDLKGDNSTPPYKSASENRLTFPWSRTYLEVEYEHPEGMEVWTCFAVLEGDQDKTHLPICSYIRKSKT